MRKRILLVCCAGAGVFAIPARSARPVDISGFHTGAVTLERRSSDLHVCWPDEKARRWCADFRTDGNPEVIRDISLEGREVISGGRPVYWVDTGVRRGGWDQFFDFPGSAPQGIHRFEGVFEPSAVSVRSRADRAEIEFRGMRAGRFNGSIAYTIFPGSRLLQQEAALSTTEDNTAYFYDTGFDYQPASDRRPGNNMETYVSWFEPGNETHIKEVRASAVSERNSVAVKYRAIAAKLAGGSIVVLPPPHQYFFARDYTSNMGYMWYRAWRGHVGLGIRQYPDDNSPYYPWMNAPPGTVQKMSLFLLLSDAPPAAALNDATNYTHRDRFLPLEGFKTVAPHWHFAYTEQAVAYGPKWTPPWLPVLRNMGVNAVMIMDFHGDLHPQDPGPLRFKELREYYEECKARSGADFLIIPAEEADVYFGGHWALAFPKPVYWAMKRESGEWKSSDSEYGTVYRIRNAAELLQLVRAENAFVYETHPRTKGSTGFPDAILDKPWFEDEHYHGTGWKQMPSDLSSPRLGERAFKVHDDLANRGFHKKMFGEVDVFQLDKTHELYAHMNVNYVRMPSLPAWKDYSQVLDALARADGFVTTGEILLSSVKWSPGAEKVSVDADVRWTFPLRMAEIVWGDGQQTHYQEIDLSQAHQFGERAFTWSAATPDWKWARLAVWDAAGDGAFTNAVWRGR
jgi:hypothetical protein